MSILRIDSSANTENSVTRDLTDRIITQLGDTDVTVRDLALEPLPQITNTWAVARAPPRRRPRPGTDRSIEGIRQAGR